MNDILEEKKIVLRNIGVLKSRLYSAVKNKRVGNSFDNLQIKTLKSDIAEFEAKLEELNNEQRD